MARIRSIKPEFWPSTNGHWQGDECHLYIVQEGKSQNLKVGVAVNPIWRVSGLRSGNPRKLHLRAVYGGTRADCIVAEAAVLEDFSGKRLQGEWIRCPLDQVVNFIDAVLGEGITGDG